MIHFQANPSGQKDATLVLCDKEKGGRFRLPPNVPLTVKQALRQASPENCFKADAGEILPLVFKGTVILLAGCGSEARNNLTGVRIAVKKALASSLLKNAASLEIIPLSQAEAVVIAVIEGLVVGTYAWTKYLASAKDQKPVRDKTIDIICEKKKAFVEAVTICAGVNLCRDFINDNADLVTSVYVEKEIKKIIRGCAKASIEILTEKELKAKGLNLHLAVNQGSANPPRLILVRYRGASRKSAPVTALVGKGLTFDTGGLNLKPTGHIETMRCDMSGAAALVGVLKNTIALNLKVNATFVFGLAENVTGSKSYKPGDVLTGYSGKTVEIGNTDAEGRLVLADAIAYVVKNDQPQELIDIATLTGACVVALGYDYTGLVSSDETMAKKLTTAARETDDRVWQLPVYPELKDYIKSTIADVKNIGIYRGAAGTITAAEFLRQFTDDIPWAHLDIAGTAFSEGQGRLYFNYGATGAGVRLLTRYLQNR